MAALVEVSLEAGIYIMSDEIYEYLLYDDVNIMSPASFSSEAANAVITVAGFSKTFSTDWLALGDLNGACPDCESGGWFTESNDLKCNHLCAIWSFGCNAAMGCLYGCG